MPLHCKLYTLGGGSESGAAAITIQTINLLLLIHLTGLTYRYRGKLKRNGKLPHYLVPRADDASPHPLIMNAPNIYIYI